MKWQSVTAAAGSCIVLFMVTGIFARAWIERYGDALEKTKHVLEADAHLGWKQRSNLSTTFLGLPLTTDERGWRTTNATPPQNEKVLLVAGPSSTFGWGVTSEDTYAAQLQTMLGDRARVYNAGEIGYSSEQGMRLLTEELLHELHPDVVVLAYGVNDIDRYRFYFHTNTSDREEFGVEKPANTITFTNSILSDPRMVVLQRIATWVRSFATPVVPNFVYSENPVPRVRVTAQEFGENMETLIARSRAAGAEVVVLTTEVFLPTALAYPDTEELTRALVPAEELYRSQQFSEAHEAFEALSQQYGSASEPFYYLSAISAADGDTQQAFRFLQRARERETNRIPAEVQRYNTALEHAAERHGVMVGNLAQWFGTTERKTLFVDPIHFSVEGNALVAKGLYAIVSQYIDHE